MRPAEHRAAWPLAVLCIALWALVIHSCVPQEDDVPVVDAAASQIGQLVDHTECAK